MKKSKQSNNPFKQELGAGAQESTDTQVVLFSFEKMAASTGYSVSCCEDHHLSALMKKLFQLRATVWRDLKNTHRHGIGTEKIASTAIKPSLPRGISPDTTLLALRYSGRNPVVGYREGRYFHVLFIDHNFSVYSHG